MMLSSRFMNRIVWSHRQLSAQLPNHAPKGVQFFPSFISLEEQADFTDSSLNLLKNIHDFRKAQSESVIVKTITSLSQQHNLTSDEYFERVEIKDEASEKTLRAQYFDKYGDHGHQLTYFMNNNNIPSFVKDKLIAKLLKLDNIKGLMHDSGEILNWMLTFNTYYPVNNSRDENDDSSSASSVVPGFPYHVDSDFNGDVTVILTLGCPALMELRPLPDTTAAGGGDSIHGVNSTSKSTSRDINSLSLELTPGSLLLLSGEARWKWEHRVVPSHTTTTCSSLRFSGSEEAEGEEAIPLPGRMSLVLGCRNKERLNK
jgi:hypothetical protein